MKKKSELSELVDAVERVRATLHPTVDPAFVARVVEIEAKHAEDEAKAIDSIRRLVDEFAKSKGD